jgi:hypothetical protein
MAAPVLPKLVGARVKRREDPRLIRGLATYVDDVKLVGMLHIAFKRSDVAHARIRSIDTAAALAMEGVEAGTAPFRGRHSYWAVTLMTSQRPGSVRCMSSPA